MEMDSQLNKHDNCIQARRLLYCRIKYEIKTGLVAGIENLLVSDEMFSYENN